MTRAFENSESNVPLFLLETRVNADAREIAGHEQFVKFNSTSHRLNENHDLDGMARKWTF